MQSALDAESVHLNNFIEQQRETLANMDSTEHRETLADINRTSKIRTSATRV
jgi:hypothetical protein